jgi:hypothetical protein
LKASQDFFNGKHFNSTATGEGLGSYLDYLKQSVTEQLSSINKQFTTILPQLLLKC